MIDMGEVYRKARTVLSEMETMALLQDRHMLGVLIVNEFKGEYVFSSYEIENLFEGRPIAISTLVLDSGEVALEAKYTDED